MRLIKGLICAALICALSLSAFAEDVQPVENTPAPVTQAPETAIPVTEAPATPIPETQTAQPTASATEEATQQPTQSPSDTPESTPDAQPTQDPSPAPTAQPGEEPSEEPSQQPSESPSAQPTAEPTAQPSMEPTVQPSMEPDATPRPQPGADSGLISIMVEGDAQDGGDFWKITLRNPTDTLQFTWSCAQTASSYLVYSADAAGNVCFICETQDERIALSAADYANGRFTLHVGAVLADGSVAWGSLRFELSSSAAFPGGMGRPGGFGGGGFGGSFGGDFGAMQEEQMGFRVTPGEALTSSHASGTKDSAAYVTSEIPDSADAMALLSLTSTQTQIMLDSGENAFYASSAEGTLVLIPESDGTEWQLSVLAMHTLADSGMNAVVFQIGGATYSLPTRMEFSGSVYAALRAQGYVSKDCLLSISDQGVIVCVGENRYSISEQNELIPLGADAQ